jgi:hypothetical protein
MKACKYCCQIIAILYRTGSYDPAKHRSIPEPYRIGQARGLIMAQTSPGTKFFAFHAYHNTSWVRRLDGKRNPFIRRRVWRHAVTLLDAVCTAVGIRLGFIPNGIPLLRALYSGRLSGRGRPAAPIPGFFMLSSAGWAAGPHAPYRSGRPVHIKLAVMGMHLAGF